MYIYIYISVSWYAYVRNAQCKLSGFQGKFGFHHKSF